MEELIAVADSAHPAAQQSNNARSASSTYFVGGWLCLLCASARVFALNWIVRESNDCEW